MDALNAETVRCVAIFHESSPGKGRVSTRQQQGVVKKTRVGSQISAEGSRHRQLRWVHVAVQ